MSQIEFDQLNISIHALTRSATLQRQSCICQEIFQSTHSRGVRPLVNTPMASPFYFNPRTHEECDSTLQLMSHRWCYFNPRTHEECDRLLVKLVNRMLLFQSTHSRGVRHQFVGHLNNVKDISIHALTRSATPFAQ